MNTLRFYFQAVVGFINLHIVIYKLNSQEANWNSIGNILCVCVCVHEATEPSIILYLYSLN